MSIKSKSPLTVSCIIPAYNEEARIGDVLKAVSNSQLVNEIIVVDDGSVDQTGVVAAQFPKVKVIRQKNQGKAAAVHKGVSQASGEIILLLDADLHGLKTENVDDLVRPVLDSPDTWAIGAPRDPLGFYLIFGFDFLSGERAFPKRDFEQIGDLSSYEYALEVKLNQYILKHKITWSMVPMSNVAYKLKTEKFGLAKGLFYQQAMAHQIIKKFGFFPTISQVVRLQKNQRSRSTIGSRTVKKVKDYLKMGVQSDQ